MITWGGDNVISAPDLFCETPPPGLTYHLITSCRRMALVSSLLRDEVFASGSLVGHCLLIVRKGPRMAPSSPRRMRSAAVNLGLVGALALSLSGCGGTKAAPPVQRQCVDDFGQIVAEAQCLVTPVASSGTTSSSRPSSSRTRWYYGGNTSGGRVTGGSYDPPPARSTGSNNSSVTGSGGKSGSVDTGGFGGGKTGSTSSGSSSSSGGKSGGSSSSGGS